MNEKLTLCWKMDDEAWSHWVQGRGRKAISDVIREGVEEIRQREEARKEARKICTNLEQRKTSSSERNLGKHSIAVEISAADWGEACQRVGKPGSPFSPGSLLAAIILESESWKQDGKLEAEKHSGWVTDNLIRSTTTADLTSTRSVTLGRKEHIIGWVIAGSSTLSAICAAIAILSN